MTYKNKLEVRENMVTIWICFFQAADIEVQLTDAPKRIPPTDSLFFGQEFSDHMFSVEWTENGHWNTPRITPLTEISLHPAAKVLQYATTVRKS